MPVTTACPACGRTVLWARNAETGSPTPIDPRPGPGGTLLLCRGPGGLTYRRTQSQVPVAGLRRPHAATCPHRYRPPTPQVYAGAQAA